MRGLGFLLVIAVVLGFTQNVYAQDAESEVPNKRIFLGTVENVDAEAGTIKILREPAKDAEEVLAVTDDTELVNMESIEDIAVQDRVIAVFHEDPETGGAVAEALQKIEGEPAAE